MRRQAGTRTDPDAPEGRCAADPGISPLAARRSRARSAAAAGRLAGCPPACPRVLAACLSGFITSSLTPRPARAGPVLDAGTRLEDPVRARPRDRHRDWRERAGRHVL